MERERFFYLRAIRNSRIAMALVSASLSVIITSVLPESDHTQLGYLLSAGIGFCGYCAFSLLDELWNSR